MKTYIFPLNFDYSPKFLGMFEYKTLAPLAIFGFIFANILKLVEVTLTAKITIFLTIFIPLFLLLNTKIHKEPLLHFIFCIIKHFLFCGIYKK